MTEVFSGQNYSVTNTQTDTFDVVDSGGNLYVEAGGTISTTFDDGFVFVEVGGSAYGTMVQSGAFQFDYGTALFTNIVGGGQEGVEAGGHSDQHHRAERRPAVGLRHRQRHRC